MFHITRQNDVSSCLTSKVGYSREFRGSPRTSVLKRGTSHLSKQKFHQ